MQDRMMEEIQQDISHIEETLERHRSRTRVALTSDQEAQRRARRKAQRIARKRNR